MTNQAPERGAVISLLQDQCAHQVVHLLIQGKGSDHQDVKALLEVWAWLRSCTPPTDTEGAE